MASNREISKLLQATANVETDVDESDDSEEEVDLTVKPPSNKTKTTILTNSCLHSSFLQGTIQVQVHQTILLQPLQCSTVNTQILFDDDLPNFVTFFKAHSRLNISSVALQRLKFFVKPKIKERFTLKVVNQSKQPVQLYEGTSLGYIFLYPYF